MFNNLFKKTPTVITDEKQIEEVLSRGVDEVIGVDELKKRMLSGERLRIKLGIDPTSPDLHLGRSVPLLKMRDFQELGHQLVLIVGDFTGVIGDTSDKDSERPMLSREVIEENKKSYFEQIGKLIDVEQAELRYNSDWLEPLTYREIGRQANAFSVADFIARDNIRRRLDAGKRVSLRETLYPLMQGYDSVAIKADVEIGGVDQRFNLLAGRTLQEEYGQKPQHIVTTTFPVEGLDGRKMSSSWGNTITFNETPENMYGRVMRVNDELIVKYFTILTRAPLSEVEKIQEQLAAGENPKDIKMRLAREIVKIYHDAPSAERAEHTFVQAFSEGVVPDSVPEVSVQEGELLIDTLVGTELASSKTEARRLIENGAVRNVETGEKYTDIHMKTPRETVLKVGKKNFVKFS